MSISQGLPQFLATAANVGTRIAAPVHAGALADGVVLPVAGGVLCVQSTASVTAQTVTPSAAVLGSRASFMYIPVSTISFIGGAAPPYLGVGTPLVWNDAAPTLMVWSSSRTSWMMLSTAGGLFTSSST